MLYTLISFFIIFLIILTLAFAKSGKTTSLENYSLLSQGHTRVLLGIATSLIVITHIANYKEFSVLIPLGGVGTVLFLICSGYGLNESFKSKGLGGFFKKRMLRLMLPYWLMVILFWIINFENFSFLSFAGSFVLLNRLPFMWFIYFIMMWYVIFYFSKKYLNVRYGTAALFLIGFLFMFIFTDTTQGEKALAFPLGVLLSQASHIKQILVAKKYKAMLLTFGVGAIFSMLFLALKIRGFDTLDNYLMMNAVQILMKVSLSLFIIQFTYNYKSFIYAGFASIGLYAYEIYLTHTLVIGIVRYNPLLMIAFFIMVVVMAVTMKKVSSYAYDSLTERSVLPKT